MRFIFVGGSGHNGTSLLAAMLGAHSKIYSIPFETGLFLRDLPAREIQSELAELERKCDKRKAIYLCEKTPNHVRHFREIAHLLPEARFIAPVRDPRDVVASYKRRGETTHFGIRQWLRSHQSIDGISDLPLHVFPFERLVTEPESTLERICSFLDLNYEEAMLDYWQDARPWFTMTNLEKPENASGANHRAYRNWQIHQPLMTDRVGNYSNLSAEELAKIKSVLAVPASERGYNLTSNRRALIATNHLVDLAGSEMVAFEFAQHFRSMGAEVTVFANIVGTPMRERFQKAKIPLVDDPSLIRPFTFDLVYFQHQVAGLFDYSPSPADRSHSIFAFGRLSPFGFMESGGWAHEVLADVVYANSAETADSLRERGVSLPIKVFHNAAPARFHLSRKRDLPERPRKILVVTNHRDPTLMQVVNLLKEHAEVQHIGRTGTVLPVTHTLIQSVDLVVSIGKTVQYALASKTPVFVYDRWGGPGYLNAGNFDRASYFNFSGRCTPGVRTAYQLVEEIITGYRLFTPDLRQFYLPDYLNEIAGQEPTSNDERRSRLARDPNAVHRERLMAAYIRAAAHRARRKMKSRQRSVLPNEPGSVSASQ